MTKERVEGALDQALEGLSESMAAGFPVYRGKVRDVVIGGKSVFMVASDRLSAFDRVLSTVPFKGEILSRIAEFWFERTKDIIANHVLAGPKELGCGRAMLCRKVEMLPLEVVVRGYLTGAAWRNYREGVSISGIRLPEGLSYNEKFPVPLVTPFTKEKAGHDLPIARDEIFARGLVEPKVYAEIERVAVALFRRGQEIAAQGGLILVDAKYEFGQVGGHLVLADELHTPDSSRFWWAEGYESRLYAGDPQKELDKEPFRRWLLDRGFSGEGHPPAIPNSMRVETALRYIQTFEAITGGFFETEGLDSQSEAALLARSIKERLSID